MQNGTSFITINYRLLVFFVVVTLFPQTGVGLNNEQRRLIVIDQYQQERTRYNWYYRSVFLLTSRLVYREALRHCQQENGECDEQQLRTIVSLRADKLAQTIGTMTGYGIALSAVILSAYMGAKLNEVLAKVNMSDASRDFIRVFIPIITGFGVFSVGAPLWDPVRSSIRRWAFASNQVSQQRAPFEGKYPQRPDLEQHWLNMQKYFSVNAQISRNTLSQFLVLISPSREDFRFAYDQQRYQYAAAQLAKVMVQRRFLYSEIDPDDAILTISIQSYTINIRPSMEFLSSVLNTALTLDPLGTEDLNGRSYYQSCLKAWFNVEVGGE